MGIHKKDLVLIDKALAAQNKDFQDLSMCELGSQSLRGEPGRYAYSVINVKDFVNFHQNVINALNDVIKNRDAYVFGAHIFTQFLLSFGLNTEKIISVLDNDPGKIGHRLYGTDLHVTSPKELKDQNEPVVILRAAQYNDEIRKDIEENINEKVRFVTGE